MGKVSCPKIYGSCPPSNQYSVHYGTNARIHGILPCQYGKLCVAAFETCLESTQYGCYPPHPGEYFPSCALLYLSVNFQKLLIVLEVNFSFQEERKKKKPFDSVHPVCFVTYNGRKAKVSSCPFCAVLIYLYAYVYECDCACESMCDNIIQMPHHTVGLCQSHPMKHTEQMLIVKS